MTLAEVHPSAAEWNARIAATPRSNMFQTFEMGLAKARAGWRPRFFEVDGVPVVVHERRAPGLGLVWYVPKGPIVADVQELGGLLPQLADAAREAGAFLLKIEPELPESFETLAALSDLGLQYAGRIQNSVSTVLLDISGTAEELMARLPSRTRNTIRKGAKEGVEVEAAHADEASYARMWDLWEQVVADQGVFTRSRDYHVALWRDFCEAGSGQLFFARHEGRDIAGAFVVVVGTVANYREGASVRGRPVRGSAQLLQYEAMSWAQERGATTYDLCGTPHSSRVDDPEDPLHGVGEFKRGFSKEVTDWVGAFDLPLRPVRYALWERIGHRVAARLTSRDATAATFF